MNVNKKLLIKYSFDLLPFTIILYVFLNYQQKMNDLGAKTQDQSLANLMKLLFAYLIISSVMILSNVIMYMRVSSGKINMAYRRNYAALETLLVIAHIIMGLIIILMTAIGFTKLNEVYKKDQDAVIMFSMIWASVGFYVILDIVDLIL